MSVLTAPMPPALRDPTAAAAIARADSLPPSRPATHAVIYDAAVRVRRGSEPLTATMAEWLRAKYDGR